MTRTKTDESYKITDGIYSANVDINYRNPLLNENKYPDYLDFLIKGEDDEKVMYASFDMTTEGLEKLKQFERVIAEVIVLLESKI